MPGTVLEDIEIIDAGHGGGTGTPAGGDDDYARQGAGGRFRAAPISPRCNWDLRPS